MHVKVKEKGRLEYLPLLLTATGSTLIYFSHQALLALLFIPLIGNPENSSF